MDYPRLIYLDEDAENRLRSYINEELLIHYGERGAWVQDLIDIQDEYFAEPSSEEKVFPFKGAANIIIPLIATVVEALQSKVMTTLFALEDFAVVKVPGIFDDINWGLSKYVNYELLENGADMYKFCDNSSLENLKFGTCVGKAGYEKIEKTAVKTIGDKEHEFTITTKQGAIVDSVPLANFLMPFSATDPQTSPWCGEEHLMTSYQVKQLCDSEFFYDDTWDKLKNWVMQTNSLELSSTPYTDEVRKLQDQSPVWPKTIGFCELWLSFDVDDSGKEKEIVVYYHRLSNQIIGIRYNWYDDLRRPYRIGRYFPVEHRWAGIGVGKQVKNFQREITIQHRQRLDNATIANIRMFKIQKQAGYGPGEPIFPGKMWFVDSMDDIESLEAGEIYPSSFNDEIQTLSYVQQRSGINELNLGMPQVGTPGTASSDMARLQEGNKKFDYTYGNYKKFVRDIARDVVSNSMQFGARKIEIFNYIPNGDQVQQFIQSAPQDLINSQLIMNINLVSQDSNKLQDRAAWTQLSGQLSQYYTQLFEFAMQIKDQQLLQELAQIIPSGATEAMKQILETFDIRSLDRIIPESLIMGQKAQIQNPQILQQLGQIPLLNSGQPNGPTGNSQPGTPTGTPGVSQAS